MPADPVRASDNTYTYAFTGWDSEVTTCQGNKTYKATYFQQYIEYTIKFVDYDNSVRAGWSLIKNGDVGKFSANGILLSGFLLI